MISWRDEGVLLAARPHGENAAIIDVLTAGHGRTPGLVRGGSGRRMTPILQAGAQLDLTWKARLEDHLGAYTVEPIRSRAAGLLGDAKALAGLQSATALLARLLPERQAEAGLYVSTTELLDLMAVTDAWPLAYLRWELALLDALGYGLDLGSCAVTGAREELAFVSPKSGRAVSRAGAGAWAPKLLPLPAPLLADGEGSDLEIADALHTTGFFLAKTLEGQDMPAARARLEAALRRVG